MDYQLMLIILVYFTFSVCAILGFAFLIRNVGTTDILSLGAGEDCLHYASEEDINQKTLIVRLNTKENLVIRISPQTVSLKVRPGIQEGILLAPVIVKRESLEFLNQELK